MLVPSHTKLFIKTKQKQQFVSSLQGQKLLRNALMYVQDRNTKPAILFTLHASKHRPLEVKHVIMTRMADPKDIKPKTSLL